MKWSRDSSSGERSNRREVAFYTYKKWITELDHSFQSLSWLDCDTRLIEGKRYITRLIEGKFYHKTLLTYICGWPNTFLNGQILVEVFGHMS